MSNRNHPYQGLPEYCFWRESVSAVAPEDIDPVISAKFPVHTSDRVVTAGSCFAQHLAKHLEAAGFNHFVTETAHPFIAHSAADYNYGTYSARYGNIYTSRQLLQLVLRAYGELKPLDDVWEGSAGHVIDPFRPRIQPNGFASMREFQLDRANHFAAVRRALEHLDIFVFTLGLTEVWINSLDGAAYPLCPGVAGGSFGNEHHLINLTVSDVASDLNRVIDLILLRNPQARFILTVSPVPLVATAETRSVIMSSMYSKCVLRVAAEEVSAGRPNTVYFPSFEIITSPATVGVYFAPDHRSVTSEGVSHVMRLFLKHYGQSHSGEARREQHDLDGQSSDHIRQMESMTAVICDEEALQRA